MSEERVKPFHFGNHFPTHNKYWMQALEAAQKCIRPGDRLFATPLFLKFFPQTLPYRFLTGDSLPGAEWLIFQKNLAGRIGPQIMREIKQRLTPIFANEYFVIFSNKASAPKFDFDPRHVQALWVKMDELEKTSQKQHLEKKLASFASVITTYNRPWALARSLPQVVSLGYPVTVVDDGSDSSYHADYKSIRDLFAQAAVYWIHLPANRGVSCAINMGVSYFLADPSIDWISYFQDDVDVHPDLFKQLAKVQDSEERPLLTGRYALGHPVVAESDINGVHVLSYHSIPGQHLHAHRNYWQGVMPVPSNKIGLPKPHEASGSDWWIGSWAPNSVCKQGKTITCVPRLVSTFATMSEESTWGNTPIPDDVLPQSKKTPWE